MSEDWFEVRCVAPDLWMIAEPLHVVSWLYIGSERAALLDTGTGIAPIAPIVASLTGRPVVVVNTHYHFDHTASSYFWRINCSIYLRPAAVHVLLFGHYSIDWNREKKWNHDRRFRD